MPTSSSVLRKRMAKVKQQLGEKARREKLVNCNCQLVTLALSDAAEKFESEMNLPCPGHGRRTLGTIVRLQLVKSTFCPDDGDDSDESWDRYRKGIVHDDVTKIDALIDLYKQRYRQHVRREAEEGSDEF